MSPKPGVMKLIAADVFAALPTFVWLYIFAAEVDHYASMPKHGYSGVWDGAVYFPLAMSLGLLMAIAVFNFATRKPAMIALIAGAALLPILPFGMMISGGV